MKVRTLLECTECRQQVARWVGRCPGCGGWGTIHEAAPAGAAGSSASLQTLAPDAEDEPRASTGFTGRRPRARRRPRPGIRDAARRRAGHRQVHPPAPSGRQPVGRRAALRARLGRGVSSTGGSSRPAAGDRRPRDLLPPGPRARGRPPDRSRGRSLPPRRGFHPGVARRRRLLHARRSVPGAVVHGCPRRTREEHGDRRAPHRPRDEGRRPGRTADAGARRRRRVDVRRRPALRPADARGRQEPIRTRGRGRMVRDGRAWAPRDRSGGPACAPAAAEPGSATGFRWPAAERWRSRSRR